MSTVSPLALLAPRELDAPLAWRDGRPFTGHQFLAEVQALAQALPPAAPVINLCRDRLDFAVGLAASLVRGVPSLLPPNALPATLASLRAEHGDCSVLGEVSATVPGLQVLAWPGVGAAAVPALAAGPLPPWAHTPADQTAAVLLTSGSTGTPVAHARRWWAVVENARAQAQRLGEALGRPGLDQLTLVSTVPAQHSYGFESSVMLAWQSGACIDAGRPFYPADIVAALARVPRPRALVTTPFHLKTLLDAGLTLPPVDLIMSATAPLSPQLAAEAEARLQGPLIEVFGCTEVGQIATRRPTQAPTWRTYGELRVQALAHEGEAAEGEGGERFVVSGGYAPAPTVLADVLELDDDRHFRLLGRVGDLIHVAGKRSSIAHLNYQLNSIPGVRDGACWMPAESPDGIVRPMAFVVAPGLTPRQISAALRERLDPVFVPRRIVMLDRLPREATGKLTAATLSQMAARS